MTEGELRAALSGLSGFTLWRTAQVWQASTKAQGSDGWHCVIAADPAEAVLRALGLYGTTADTQTEEDVFG